MMNSNKSFDSIDLDAWSMYEKDIEEILVDSDEEYAGDIIAETVPIPNPQIKEREKEPTGIALMYSTIQKLLGGVESEEEPRLRILKKATAACKQLCQEELNLKLETEVLLQTNWKLKRRVEILQKKKKRKSVPATVKRRLSGPPVTTPTKASAPIEKISASVDESKIVILPTNQTETILKNAEKQDATKTSPPVQKIPKRKVKKRSGLTEEEKEFYKLEEKIEDLLYEVEALWNDVQNDEKESDLEDKKVIENIKQVADVPVAHDSENVKPAASVPVAHVTPFSPTNELPNKHRELIKLTDISKLIEPDLVTGKSKEMLNLANIAKEIEPQTSKKSEVIKIANINKLLDPKKNLILANSNTSSFKSIVSEKRRSSTSGDESPRLVIDESPHEHSGNEQNKSSEGELDMMAALQAVDTLCLSLVSDEPTTSETQPVVVEMKKVTNAMENPDIISISDSEDELV